VATGSHHGARRGGQHGGAGANESVELRIGEVHLKRAVRVRLRDDVLARAALRAHPAVRMHDLHACQNQRTCACAITCWHARRCAHA
jgi:hypothetical protein